MSRHIVLGDVHLGKGLSIGKPGANGKLNSRVQDQINLLEWVLEQALERKISNIIITGDIYQDPRPHPAVIQIFMSWLKKCEKFDIRVDIVVGNHDIVRSGSYSISALDIVPAVELTHANVHKDVANVEWPDGVSFTFLPYRDRKMYDSSSPDEALELLIAELEANKPSPNKKRVLVGHLALKGSLYIGDEVDDMLNEIFCPLQMFDNYDYVWMGHIHKPQVMTSGKNHIAHVGSMDRSDFYKSELDHKKVMIVIDTNSESFFEEVMLPVRQLRKVEIAVPADKDTTDFIINSLHGIDHEESLKNAIVRLEITLDGSEAANADRDKVSRYMCENLGVHHICNFSEIRNIVVVQVDKLKETVFSDSMTVPNAIEAFFNSAKFENDEERTASKKLALEWYDEYKGLSSTKDDAI